MSFNGFEINYIKNLFNIGETDKENISEKLPKEIYDFLYNNEHVKTIIDRIIYRKKTRARPFDSLIVTKFLTNEVNLKKLFEQLCENVSGSFLIYVDFHFLLTTKSDKTDLKLKFQHGSKSSSFNDTHKIVIEKDVQDFLNEFKNKTASDFLNESFINHRDLFDFHGSGFAPYALLGLVFTLQKIP